MGAELVRSVTAGTVLPLGEAQVWDIEITKEEAVELASWGDDKFIQAGESLSQIKTNCPRLKSP